MQTHAFDNVLTATARGRVRLPSMPGQSEVGTCRERTDGQWHGEIVTIMWSMAGVLPFHASRCIRKRKAFAQSTPGSNSRGSRPRPAGVGAGCWSEHDSTQRILAHCSAVRHCALHLHHLRGAASDELQCRCRECFFERLTPCPAFHWAWGEQLQRRGELPRTRP